MQFGMLGRRWGRLQTFRCHPLGDVSVQISIIDGRRFEHEGERDDAVEECQLLLNKQVRAGWD